MIEHGQLVCRPWKRSIHGVTVMPETRGGESGWYVRFNSGEYGWFKVSNLELVPRGKQGHAKRA